MDKLQICQIWAKIPHQNHFRIRTLIFPSVQSLSDRVHYHHQLDIFRKKLTKFYPWSPAIEPWYPGDKYKTTLVWFPREQKHTRDGLSHTNEWFSNGCHEESEQIGLYFNHIKCCTKCSHKIVYLTMHFSIWTEMLARFGEREYHSPMSGSSLW
jgi:hypothetical protein